MPEYIDATKTISWIKAALISFVLCSIAFLMCCASKSGNLKLQGIACIISVFLVTYFLKKKGSNPERMGFIELYDDYFICEGIYSKLNQDAIISVPMKGQHFSYMDLNFINRSGMNIVLDVGDLRITMLSLGNARETEKRLKAKSYFSV